ncbi:hypothetical protein BGZ63DRAFT_169558 [Mariannaea sp. PMI_226]|nr:hypothetical protein BGZ63DRAFT_169558 [Mariannaea sp. PMI_226]
MGIVIPFNPPILHTASFSSSLLLQDFPLRDRNMPTNWIECEREAFRLYVEEDKTAEESVNYLNQHGYDITMRHFKSKIGRLKNLHANEWREIGKEILKREAEGKASDVYVYGQKQSPSRIKRALRHIQKFINNNP